MKFKMLFLFCLVTCLLFFSSSGQVSGYEPPDYYNYLPIVLKEPCYTLPTLISPTNGSTLSSLSPTFQWNAGENPYATYLILDVATDPDFNDSFVTLWGNPTGEGSFRFPINFASGTTYYWHAQLRCDEVNGPFTAAWSFTTGSGGTIPPAPTLKSPADGSTLSSLSVILKWYPVSGAIEYYIFIHQIGSGTTHFLHTTGTQINVPSWISLNATYEWWVVARNSYAFSSGSDIWEFTTPSNAAPSFSNFMDHNVFVQEKVNENTYIYWR